MQSTACKRFGAATDTEMLLAGGLRAAVHTQRVATPLMMARMLDELPAEGTLGASFAVENPVNLNPALSILQSPLDLLTAAADGDIAAYKARHALPEHPLVSKGFPSIGCRPCTSAIGDGEDQRAGRWRGQQKLECGLHNRPNIIASSEFVA